MFPYAIPIMNFDVFQWVKLVKRTIFWINLKSVKWNNRFIYHFTSFFFFADSPFFLQIVEIYCCELYPGLHQEKKERKEMCEWETLLRKFFGINGKKGKKVSYRIPNAFLLLDWAFEIKDNEIVASYCFLLLTPSLLSLDKSEKKGETNYKLIVHKDTLLLNLPFLVESFCCGALVHH